MDPAQETIDYIAVSRLHHAYADIATRRAWSELDDIFVPEIPVTVDLRDRDPYVFDSRGGFRDFVSAAVDRFEFFEFVILNSRVYLEHEGNPDAAVARMYMSELRQDLAERRWTAVYGVYHDQFRRIDGRWWYVSRNYSSLARPGTTSTRSPSRLPNPSDPHPHGGVTIRCSRGIPASDKSRIWGRSKRSSR